MIGQSRVGAAGVVVRRRTLVVTVGTCVVLGLLEAAIAIGDVVDRRDPPSDDLVALWLLAEIGACVVSAGLLTTLLTRGTVAAGLALTCTAAFSAATPAAAVAVVVLVGRASRRTGVAAAAAFVVSASLAVLLVAPDEAAALLPVVAGIGVVLVLVGAVVNGRLAVKEQARREHELLVERARSQERSRIAGEMHDSLSHHLSLIALHAGALGRRDDLPPDTVRSSSRLVAELSRTAHAELREVLGVLGGDVVHDPAPPATAADLADLVEQHRAAGAHVRASLDPAVVGTPAGQGGRLSETTSRLVHRVAREMLANAARHAPGAPVELTVAAHGDRVEVRCRNQAPAGRPAPDRGSSGLGLAGMAERVAVAGGRFRAGVEDGGFVVEVSAPW